MSRTRASRPAVSSLLWVAIASLGCATSATAAGAGVPGSHGSIVWKGVRYAQPPTGEHRWRSPRPVDRWSGEVTPDRSDVRCPQPDTAKGPGQVRGDEDCLVLNIWAPPAASESRGRGARLPVMVWLHPGANVTGAGADFDGGQLAVTQNVVVVTVEHRLGVLGWLHHPALAEDASREEQSGNFGTLDQLEALRWVRRNIALAGGDPRRVTVFGESAGGWNVYALLSSPLGAGLFHRAIVQSGHMPFYTPAQATNYVDDAEPGVVKSARELLGQLLIDAGRAHDRASMKIAAAGMSAPQIGAFLRSRSYPELLRAERTLYEAHVASGRLIGQQRYLPGLMLDGVVLPRDSFLEVAQRGAVRRVPVLLGSNRDEDVMGLAYHNPHFARRIGPGTYLRLNSELYDPAVEYLGQLWKADGVDEPAALLARTQPVFVYRFDWDEQDRTPAIRFVNGSVGAMHEVNVPFLTGIPGLELAPAARQSFDTLSAAMMSYWAQFAYGGDPGRGRRGDLPLWRRWADGPERGRMLVLDSATGGGIREQTDYVTVESVLAGIRADPRLPGIRERCRLYYEFANHAFGANHRLGRLTPRDYAAAEQGACAREYPLLEQQARAFAARPGARFRDCARCPELVVVPAGMFEMGSDSPAAGNEDETPRHRVVIDRDLAVGVHEITRAEFATFVEATGYVANDMCNGYGDGGEGDGWWKPKRGRNWRTPGFSQTEADPVVCVSWLDAGQYLAWLSRETGRRYRLLSETEWEYVASAGGIDVSHDTANYGAAECCGPWTEGGDVWPRTAPVGSFAADAFGLHDVVGNVWEWTEDCYQAGYDGAPTDGSSRRDCVDQQWRSVRGGSYGDAVAYLRPTYRLRAMPANAYFTLGFRVARSID